VETKLRSTEALNFVKCPECAVDRFRHGHEKDEETGAGGDSEEYSQGPIRER
jgi:hypothetical protein